MQTITGGHLTVQRAGQIQSLAVKGGKVTLASLNVLVHGETSSAASGQTTIVGGTVTHNLNITPPTYTVLLTPVVSTNAAIPLGVMLTSQTSNAFTYKVYSVSSDNLPAESIKVKYLLHK